MLLTVHYRQAREAIAPCGYRFRRGMHGLDHAPSFVATPARPYVANCTGCVLGLATGPAERRPPRAAGPVTRTLYGSKAR